MYCTSQRLFGEPGISGNENINLAIEEIRRIEKLLTTNKDDSQTNLINKNAGIQPVIVDLEVFNLIERFIGISKITQGIFDISYGSMDKSLWKNEKNIHYRICFAGSWVSSSLLLQEVINNDTASNTLSVSFE